MRARHRFYLLVPAAAAILFGSSVSASAGPSHPNGGNAPTSPAWVQFYWDESGVAGPFSYTSSSPLYLVVTDSYCRGDQFSITDNGVLVGETAAVPLDPECDDVPFLTTPILSYRDPTYSSAQFVLPAGEHSILIEAFVNPFGSGSGFVGAWYNPSP